MAAALQPDPAAQRAGLSAPGPRGAILAQACIASAIGVRVDRRSELTSGWTNQWGQANLDLQPIHLWWFYNDRAALELIIRELKGDYPLGRVPAKHFFANEAYFHLLLFAYNLMQCVLLPPNPDSQRLK